MRKLSKTFRSVATIRCIHYSHSRKAGNTFDGVMAAGSWNLIDQDGFELYKECEKRGMYIHNAGIYASGLLVGGSTYKYGPADEEVIAKKKRRGEALSAKSLGTYRYQPSPWRFLLHRTS